MQFFSHSELDLLSNNYVSSPPPLSALRVFTPVDSTDPTISAAAAAVLLRFSGWERVPEGSVDLEIPSGTFWVETARVSSQVRKKGSFQCL